MFGEADAFVGSSIANNCADETMLSNVRSSSAAHETNFTGTSEQNQRRVVNYGPCVVCQVNKACILFIGCNLLACCNQCSETCGNFCPVPSCNHLILERLRVFELT